MSDAAKCTICQQPIEARQTVVFQADGQLAHVTCVASTSKPLARVVPERAPNPICAACSRSIGPVQSIIKTEAGLLHVDCFLEKRPAIGGGSGLAPWSPTDDGLYWMTPAGHRQFIAACGATRLRARDIVLRAREATRQHRALAGQGR